jgi:hypothetical protein
MIKLLFHLLDLTVLNTQTPLKPCGSKLSQRDFTLTFVKNMVELAGLQPCPLQTVGRPSDWQKELLTWRREVPSIGLLKLKRGWTT